MKFLPLHDNVLIERSDPEEKSKGGILIPSVAQEKMCEGEVLAVGPGKIEDGKLVKPNVKKGDRVVFSTYGGQEIRVDGKKLTVLSEENILGIIEE